MNITVLGAAGFIGTNLVKELVKTDCKKIRIYDRVGADFSIVDSILTPCEREKVEFLYLDFGVDSNFDQITKNQDLIYHLVSTTVPTTANQHIPEELMSNVVATSYLLESCVANKVDKVAFVSSGGTVYGREHQVPLAEDTATYPISSYGIQKITIEKILYLYNYMYGLDYRVIRLANPYGPYQKPNGMLGAVTTFTYKAMKNEEISVYGDGTVIRDFIYIDDAIRGILKIVNNESNYKTYNLGCGKGHSINDVIDIIRKVINNNLNIAYKEQRKVDVPINYLDISQYENSFGTLSPISLEEGIIKTADFLNEFYNIK